MPQIELESNPLLTVQIGNTHTSLNVWAYPGWGYVEWPTHKPLPPSARAQFVRAALRGMPVVLSGVVPKRAKALLAELKRLGLKCHRFRKDYPLRLTYAPKPAERIGDDRVAGALGALESDETRPWVVVDTGTAITVNAITPAFGKKPPRFEGGLILPGARLSFTALNKGTAQLPPIAEEMLSRWKPSFIGLNTQEAMLNGVLQAELAAAVALAKGQMNILGPRTRVVLTGGLCNVPEFVRAFCAQFPRQDVQAIWNLVHVGLRASWLDYVRSRLGANARRS